MATHKNLFVLDQTQHFRSQSCDQPIEFDVFTKNRQTPAGIIPLAPICKNLHTCTLEAISEYARIMWDLHPYYDRLLGAIGFHNQGSNVLLDWNKETQSIAALGNAFAKSSINEITGKNSVNENMACASIDSTIDLLTRMSEYQQARLRKAKDVLNDTRVILISHFHSNNQVNAYVKQLGAKLLIANESLHKTNDDSKLPVHSLHLVIINTHPVLSKHIKVVEVSSQVATPFITYEVHNVKSGSFLAKRMIKFVLQHYDLTSTTVTGIPMKEEQNASTSNYDVEIVHAAEAHADLLQPRSAIADAGQEAFRSMKEDVQYETISLKWCTPKSSNSDLQHCSGVYRITAVDINARPSSCLINFLLSGSTVMLELPRLKGKCMSHMLSSHASELFIHTIKHNRTILEDLPSIGEGVGGRLTDYRIAEFCEMLRKAKLSRCKPIPGSQEAPLEKAKHFLSRQTRYFPLTTGHTILFSLNNSALQNLLQLVPKETISIDELNECKAAIFQLVSMESKSQALSTPSILRRAKRDELYKLLWKELEYFVQLHANSNEHTALLQCIKDMHSKEKSVKDAATLPIGSSLSVATKKFGLVDEAELAWKELDRFNGQSERERSDLNYDPPEKKPKLIPSVANRLNVTKTYIGGPPTSLLNIYVRRVENDCNKRRNEFKGRLNGLPSAQLYVNLGELKPENPL